MSEGKLLLQPGTLWTSVVNSTVHALECGALLSIPTNFEFVEQDGVNFLVRVLANLERKEEAKKKLEKLSAETGKVKLEKFNPFLPYDKDLFVADISETHVCILNKYNVVEHHLLMITRAFEEQESLLTLQDFTAMWACLAQIDGLVFYNGGKVAGASQPHKHLQLIKLPLIPSGLNIPIAPLLETAKFKGSIGSLTGMPFLQVFVQFDPSFIDSPLKAAEVTLKHYHDALDAVGLLDNDGVTSGKPKGAYNFLATREWMLIIPRQKEEFASISINSLGFAGSLFVRDEKQMQILKDSGPMNMLQNVAFAQI
ncbi:DUF4922 domain-containing protein [Mastigocoleus sp. MO_188.B34]|uniref:ATP adenylyltransferase family protein n=1 Tax=Mastigocoleus sp. MO_188.B34 TaxID=3036635 RepID=UPI002625079D|nr:DUF4922 domain-containing protein [Mastigocoleus sp. MO_188.B34]MDJ0694296.1 DUF4922 domain-containing protein [Mastigocoleus sp. MO_188.B34]